MLSARFRKSLNDSAENRDSSKPFCSEFSYIYWIRSFIFFRCFSSSRRAFPSLTPISSSSFCLSAYCCCSSLISPDNSVIWLFNSCRYASVSPFFVSSTAIRSCVVCSCPAVWYCSCFAAFRRSCVGVAKTETEDTMNAAAKASTTRRFFIIFLLVIYTFYKYLLYPGA